MEADEATDDDQREWEIIAVDTDTEEPEDAGYTVKFDRKYDITEESFPIDSDTATRAVEDAYGWGYDPCNLPEGARLGYLVTDTEGNYIESYVEPDDAVEEAINE